jgi:hypothetical protein
LFSRVLQGLQCGPFPSDFLTKTPHAIFSPHARLSNPGWFYSPNNVRRSKNHEASHCVVFSILLQYDVARCYAFFKDWRWRGRYSD